MPIEPTSGGELPRSLAPSAYLDAEVTMEAIVKRWDADKEFSFVAWPRRATGGDSSRAGEGTNPPPTVNGVPSEVRIVYAGGTPWWVPLIVGLGVALAAACASYAAAWWFKKRDVDRENAFRAAERVDEAEQITRRDRYDAEGGAAAVLRLVQEARVRAQPLGSQDLDDRFRAAIDYLFTFTLWQPPPGPPSGRRWHNTPQSPK